MLKFKGYENVVAYVQGVVGFNKDHVVNIAVYSLQVIVNPDVLIIGSGIGNKRHSHVHRSACSGLWEGFIFSPLKKHMTKVTIFFY